MINDLELTLQQCLIPNSYFAFEKREGVWFVKLDIPEGAILERDDSLSLPANAIFEIDKKLFREKISNNILSYFWFDQKVFISGLRGIDNSVKIVAYPAEGITGLKEFTALFKNEIVMWVIHSSERIIQWLPLFTNEDDYNFWLTLAYSGSELFENTLPKYGRSLLVMKRLANQS